MALPSANSPAFEIDYERDDDDDSFELDAESEIRGHASDEGIYAPGILMILSAILCYGLADKIYS